MAEVWGFNDRETAERLKEIAAVPQTINQVVTERRKRPGPISAVSFYRYTLSQNMGAIAGPAALASVEELVSGGASESGVTVIDPIGLAAHQMSGGRGICWKSGDVFYVLVPECEGEEISPTSGGSSGGS